MSTYTTQAAILGEIQIDDLINQLDDTNNPTPGFLNVPLLIQLIANASGKIDEKCSNLYGQQLPFSPVPASVASMALTIVCYRLYRRREVPDEKNKFTEEYNNVMAFLDEVNTGDKHLGDVPVRDFPQVVTAGRSTIYGVAQSNFPANSM